MKRLFVSIIAVAILFTMCSCSNSGTTSNGTGADANTDKVYNLRLATDVVPQNFMVERINEAVAEVAEKTDGRVNITVYPGGQLGSYSAVHSQLITGDIDMALNYVDPNYDSRLYVYIFPALIEGYDDFKTSILDKNAYLWNLLAETEADMNLELLGVFNSGLMGIGAAKQPASSFAEAIDFSVKKNCLIRIPAMDNYLNLITAMGYRTTTIAYADLYPALQSGVADGWMGGTPINNWDSFRDVIKYFLDLQVNCEPLPIVISQKSMNNLPAEYQDIIREVFMDASFDVADQCQTESEQAIENMRDYGITIIEGTDEERQKLFQDVREVVWPTLEPLIGEEVFANVLEVYGVEY